MVSDEKGGILMNKIIKNLQLQMLNNVKIEEIAQHVLPSKAASAYLSGDTDTKVISELRRELKQQGIDPKLYQHQDSLHNLMLRLASMYLAKLP